MIAVEVLLWGLVAGLVHFVAIVVLYGSPLVKRIYAADSEVSPPARIGSARPRAMSTRLLGTQIEVYIMTIGFAWLHPLLPVHGLAGAMLLAGLFAALRVYPPVWALWIQGAYSNGYLFVEVVGGVSGTVVVMLALYFLM